MKSPAVFLTVLLWLAGTPAFAGSIKVSAAISLKQAMTEIAREYEEKTGDKVELAFGSSGQLAAQIKNGHDADVFVSAAQKQIDDLTRDNLVLDKSRRVLAGNALVLIVPAQAKGKISDFKDLAGPDVKRVALGEPGSVPAGQYATQALTAMKLSEALKGRMVYGANVRQVLSYVEMGEADAGIVYATDARESGEKVHVVKTADPSTHDPIIYPAVVIKTSTKADAATKFLDFFAGEKAQEALKARGFLPAPPEAGK